MKYFVTHTGSVYEVDIAQKRIRRLNGVGDPTPRQGKDGEWRGYESVSSIVVGSPVLIEWSKDVPLLAGSLACMNPGTMTSEVVEIVQ